MDGKSDDIKQNQINELKEILPEIFTEGKIDVEKLKLTLGEDLNLQDERYVLNWAGKQDAFKVLQAQTTATLAPAPEESIDFEKTQNVFIEGENLEVLKVLQKSYYGKIKMIYIDPPYNTGNDSFIYPDKFSESKEEYLKRIGDKDEEGYLLKEGLFRKNSKESGHYHSNWLSMMYPRLFLARNLLRDDGVIFVSIDDNEVHNLRMIMNEVFGEENFVSQFIWKSRQNKDNRTTTGASIDHEYICCYSRSNYEKALKGDERKIEQYTNPDNDLKGPWASGNMVGLLPETLRPNCHYDLINPKTKINYGRPKMGWRYDKNTMEKLINEDRIIWPSSPKGRPRRKVFLNELSDNYAGFSSIIGEDIYTRNGTQEIEDLFGTRMFDFPKPSSLISVLVKQSVKNDDVILDFFAGSGTSAHAVYELNKEDGGKRKYICVQLPENTFEDSEAYKSGYKTIAEICKERIRRVIKNIKTEKKKNPDLFADQKKDLDLGFKVFKLKNSNFKIWRNDIAENEKELGKQLDAFENPIKKEAKNENMLWEILLKSGYDLNTKIEEKKISGCQIFSVSDGEMIVCLSKINENAVKEIVKQPPKKCICLDILFAKNDQLKTNTVLQMKDAGAEFKTI